MVINASGKVMNSYPMQVNAGKHQYDFDASALAPGTYFIGFKLADFGIARKLVITK